MDGENKNLLSPDKIANLDGRPVRFSSPYAEGKILTVDKYGRVTSEYSGHGHDQFWRLIPVEGGFLLTSVKDEYMVCHLQEDSGDIITKPLSYDTKGCVWKTGKSGEMYQPTEGDGEKYLWLANDKLYVTNDGYLAENWVPLSDFQNKILDSISTPPIEKWDMIPFVIMGIVVMVLLWLFFRGKFFP